MKLRCRWNWNCMVRVIVVTLLMGIPASAFAESVVFSLGFTNISANNVNDAQTGETQLSVDVVDIGVTDQVKFIFRNSGPLASSITDVYFEDGTLLSIAQLIDSDENSGDPGVDFSEDAKPGNLPSANSASPPFQATAGFTADSDPPVQPNGVNPGETLGIIFNLQVHQGNQQTVADVVKALQAANPLDPNHHTVDHLRIGIHVQGFDGGGSESFVNSMPDPSPGPSVVPEPASLSLFGIGLLAMYGFHRRKRSRNKASESTP